MITSLFNYSSWKKAGVFLAINFILQAIILQLIYPLVSTSIEPLDIQIGLTVDSVITFLDSIGPEGRNYYFWNELTLDMLFPLVYSIAYTLLLVELIKVCHLQVNAIKYVALLPLGIGISDIIENIHILIVIHQYPSLSETHIQTLSIANMLKHGLTIVVLLAIGILTIQFVKMKIRGRFTKP